MLSTYAFSKIGETVTLNLEEFHDNDILRYAILSHTWRADGEEVTFRDLKEGTGKKKAGYNKIEFCRKQATGYGLQNFWVDTCWILECHLCRQFPKKVGAYAAENDGLLSLAPKA
jgi:hypothetical protein